MELRPLQARPTRSPSVRRLLEASYRYGRLAAFYAPRASEGTQMLQVKPSTSVDMIRGHSIGLGGTNHVLMGASVGAGSRVSRWSWSQGLLPTNSGLK